MKIAKLEGNQVKPRCISFGEACDIAEENGWPGYYAWRRGWERRYDTMPCWFWDECASRQRYVTQIESNLLWQAQQKRAVS